AAVARKAQVTYHVNDGTSATSTASGTVTLPTQTRSGYRFDGWYTAASGGTRVGGAGDTYTPTADIDLYAHWTQCFTITYNANGGSGAPAASSACAGETWTCPLTYPTMGGYACKGWHTSPSATAPLYVAGETYSSISADLTLYAVWAPNSGILIFDANGGSVSEGFRVLEAGQAYGSLPTPVRSGYDFTGWYTAATGGTQVSESTAKGPSSTDTIYAHWSQATRSHYLILDCMGGAASGESTVLVELSEGAAYGTLPTPTRSGHTFVGWFTSTVGGSQISSSTTMGASNANAYAHWSVPEFTITFNANGGTTPETSRAVASGDTYGALPVPYRIGCNFEGWYTAADGGSEVSDSDCPSASTTLYAHWSNGEVLPFSISFS
ncbi:MAG: InlB B-repeat-containing protein, partial [Kiritimatiellae bacterium]|nr:InlB B-repeat-containing protein [Kiritimatiellia bacterium]